MSQEQAHLTVVTDSGIEAVNARLARLGADIRDLAREADVSREWVGMVLKGKKSASPKVLGKLEQALDRMEAEVGRGPLVPNHDHELGAGLMEFTVKGNFGVSVVVKGPVADAVALEESVARLIKRMQTDTQEG